MTSSTGELPHIRVTSDGGITGRGVGGIEITADRVTAALGEKTCTATLTEDERGQLRSLTGIRETKASGTGSPDQILYTMTVGDRTASWYGEAAPQDLAPLFDLLWRIRQRVVASC
jgi:hypothetical protein